MFPFKALFHLHPELLQEFNSHTKQTTSPFVYFDTPYKVRYVTWLQGCNSLALVSSVAL
jgi:hypothetical protein